MPRDSGSTFRGTARSTTTSFDPERAAMAVESSTARTTGREEEVATMRMSASANLRSSSPSGPALRSPGSGQNARLLRSSAQKSDLANSPLIECPQDSLCRFAGAENDHLRAARFLPLLKHQVYCSRAHRRRMPTQQGLSANPATGRQRRRENEIHLSSGCAGSTCGIVCPAHLSQNLDLTQNLGIEAGANPKQVANCGHSLVPGDHRAGRQRIGSFPAQAMKPGLPLARARPVQLTSVAGRKQNGGYPVRLEQLQNRRKSPPG